MLARGMLINQRYEVIRLVGQGGMGAVYEAIDTRLGHHVALKQTLATGPQYARVFEREARLLAHLQHPGLPRVTDHFSDDNGQFLVMDFVPGDDMAVMLRTRKAPFPLHPPIPSNGVLPIKETLRCAPSRGLPLLSWEGRPAVQTRHFTGACEPELHPGSCRRVTLILVASAGYPAEDPD
jgi:serine/threonine protein kinase